MNIFELYKNFQVVRTREVSQYSGGTGVCYKCLEKYFNKVMEKYKYENVELRFFVSQITTEEQKFFNEFLFERICASDYNCDSEIHFILSEEAQEVNMDIDEISDILLGLNCVEVVIRKPPFKEEDFVHISNLFPYYEMRKLFDEGNEYFFKLQINPEFAKSCLEVKYEMGW